MRGRKHFLLALVLATSASCGSGADIGAVSQPSGPYGALLASSSGELLAPTVSRDARGAAAKITGVQWMDNNGGAASVYLDDAGLPAKAVIGGFVFLYANWNTAAQTVDIAKIYVPGNYIEVFRGVSVSGSNRLAPQSGIPLEEMSSGLGAARASLTTQTCFPACDSEEKNLVELLKISALAIDVGLCSAAPVIGPFAAIPCLGAVVGTANLLTGDENWLGDHGWINKTLKVAGCATEVAGCVSLALEKVAESGDEAIKTQESQVVLAAEIAFASATVQSGVISPGTGLPMCTASYECTPGAYLPCLAGGTRQCSASCQWGECPPQTPAPGSCGVPAGGCGVSAAYGASLRPGCCYIGNSCTKGGNLSSCTDSCANSWFEYKGALYGPCGPGPNLQTCANAAAAAALAVCNPK